MATKIKQVQRVVSAFVRRIEEPIDALLENDALLQSAVMFKLRRLAGIDVVEVGKRRHDGIVELDQLRVFGNWLTAFAGELFGEGLLFRLKLLATLGPKTHWFRESAAPRPGSGDDEGE